MPELTLSEITVRYQREESPALQIAYLKINSGECVAVMGPSGSGKTTLINIVSGLEKPAQGKILWNSVDLCRLSDTARDRWRAEHVGLIMQDFHLYPGLSALENVLLPARFRRWKLSPQTKQRAEELLHQVGLSLEKRSIESFSRGEIQRVAVARALLQKPSILIADEPTASLDERNGEQIIELLLSLAKRHQVTLIVVTHDRRLAQRINRHIMLENGRISRQHQTEGTSS
jgi:putative ABC transport system ATP-binding protein